MRIERLELSEWGDVLPEAGFEVFHTPEALGVIDEHTPGELHLLGGFKGQEPVGLFPLHVRSKLGGRLLTSPPLGVGVGRLGPVVMPTSPKQRKKEATNDQFIRAALEEMELDGRTLVRLSCSPDYGDPRPFKWNGFDITPAFTYRIDTDGKDKEQLLRSFSRDLRNDIRKREEVDVSVRTGGMSDLKRTYDSLKERYNDQEHRLPLKWEFVRDLFDALGDRARVYVAESADGAFISGMLILYSNDTAYFWKGGAKTRRTVSPNSILHWHVLEDILTDPELESVEQYDLYTANNERLTKYKSKFGGDPSVYYVIESGGAAMTVAKGVYRLSVLGKNPLQK